MAGGVSANGVDWLTAVSLQVSKFGDTAHSGLDTGAWRSCVQSCPARGDCGAVSLFEWASGWAAGSGMKHIFWPSQLWPHQHRPSALMMQVPVPQHRGSSDMGLLLMRPSQAGSGLGFFARHQDALGCGWGVHVDHCLVVGTGGHRIAQGEEGRQAQHQRRLARGFAVERCGF